MKQNRILGVTKVIIIYPEGNMNVWNKFYGNPANNHWDFSTKNTYVKLMVALRCKVKEPPTFTRIHPLGTMNVCSTVFLVHVEIWGKVKVLSIWWHSRKSQGLSSRKGSSTGDHECTKFNGLWVKSYVAFCFVLIAIISDQLCD